MGDRVTGHQFDVRTDAEGAWVCCSCGTWPEPVGGLANRRLVYASTEAAQRAHARHVRWILAAELEAQP